MSRRGRPLCAAALGKRAPTVGTRNRARLLLQLTPMLAGFTRNRIEYDWYKGCPEPTLSKDRVRAEIRMEWLCHVLAFVDFRTGLLDFRPSQGRSSSSAWKARSILRGTAGVGRRMSGALRSDDKVQKHGATHFTWQFQVASLLGPIASCNEIVGVTFEG